jgi:SAM-dependent methyltransferase
MTDPAPRRLPIDRSTASAARMYDYLLGGTENLAVDRAAAERGGSAHAGGIDTPRAIARANRRFLGRAVRYLAVDGGVRQFLDIGTGIPTEHNVHHVAHTAASGCRIVYVDNDPSVVAHANALLEGTAEETTAFIEGDVRHPERLLRESARTLDFTKPIGLMLVAVMHLIRDDDGPHEVARTLIDALAPGSYVVISHLARDIGTDRMETVAGRFNERLQEQMIVRDRDEIARFVDGLEVLEPGLVPVAEWRIEIPQPDIPDPATMPAGPLPVYGGVARKA